jgi:hypothetical protein
MCQFGKGQEASRGFEAVTVNNRWNLCPVSISSIFQQAVPSFAPHILALR